MNPVAFTQLLVAADSLDAANRLISGLRGASVAVRSASAATERELATLLGQGQWDVLVCYAGDRLPLSSVLATLQGLEQDIPVLYVGATSTAQELPPGVREALPADAPDRLLAAVRREAEISQLKRRVRQLELQQRELEKRHVLLMEGSATAISYIQDGVHLACNPSYARCFGYDSAAAIATVPLLDLLSPDSRPAVRGLLGQALTSEARGTVRIKRLDGSEDLMELCFTPVEYHGKACVQLTVAPARGDSDYAAAVEQIGHQDLLTRLDNAAYFLTRIEQAIRAALQDNQFSSLLLVGINDFADIGAAIGRSTANIVLNDVARALQELITPRDAAARLDDHTFGILLHDGDPDRALALARDIHARINNRISPSMLTSLELGCTIGMALINGLAGDAETMLARAHANLRDKPLNADGKFQYRIGEDLRHGAGAMLDYLKTALLNRRFKLLFQPLVPIGGTGHKSYEVLTRMLDRDGNEVSPAAFLPLANLNGVGEEIDRLIVGLALDSMKDSDTERLIINITSNSLMSRTFLPWLSDKLRSGRIASDLLVLQISEVDIHGNPAQALAFCRGLRQLNAGMAICHFGCALDPFAVLDELTPTLVKLDETLVRDIIYSPQQIENLRIQIGRLHERGLLVIAPQVEDMDVLPVLWQTGADYVQGYCLQRPSDEMNYEFVHVEEITLSAAQ
jgi:diguanylate cyclase (GGDEF)-like protein/PAS domain S-box-containing protein